jgi:preprotein translocase subunit SecG
MLTALMIFHAFISVLLIVLVLLQFGKGAEAGLFSGGAAEAVFTSSQQGNILSKATVVLAVAFLVNSIVLAKLQANKTSKSLLDSEAPLTRPLNSDAPAGAAAPTDAAPVNATDAAPVQAAPAAGATEAK